MFPDSGYADHWMHEIWAFLFRVKKLKGKNKFPKIDFIKKAMSTSNDMIPELMTAVLDLEPELEPTWVDSDAALACIESYQNWLASELSAHGFVRQAAVKAKLKEICNV